VRSDMTSTRKTIGVLIDYVDYISGGYESRLRAAFEAEARKFDFGFDNHLRLLKS
jgi:hypothetical protein